MNWMLRSKKQETVKNCPSNSRTGVGRLRTDGLLAGFHVFIAVALVRKLVATSLLLELPTMMNDSRLGRAAEG